MQTLHGRPVMHKDNSLENYELILSI